MGCATAGLGPISGGAGRLLGGVWPIFAGVGRILAGVAQIFGEVGRIFAGAWNILGGIWRILGGVGRCSSVAVRAGGIAARGRLWKRRLAAAGRAGGSGSLVGEWHASGGLRFAVGLWSVGSVSQEKMGSGRRFRGARRPANGLGQDAPATTFAGIPGIAA